MLVTTTGNVHNGTNLMIGFVVYDEKEDQMPLNEQYEYDREVRGPYKAVQVRKARVIMDGDDEVARTYHRHVLHPRTRQMESGRHRHL